MVLFLAAVELTEDGDYELYFNLYNKYKRDMIVCAYAVLRNEHLAEDAVSDAFLNVLRNFETVKGLSELARGKYCLNSARNTAKNYLRKLKVQWDNEVPLEERVGCAGTWDSTFAAVSCAINRDAVRAALNRLEPDMRNLIIICVVEERSVSEAARLYNCPRTTLEYRLNKAKQCFAKEYLKITGEDNE